MTTDAITRQLDQLTRSMQEVERMQRDAAGRMSKLEGRTFELELWRARMQGAAATSRVVWLLAGGGVTAGLIELVRATGGA